MRKKPNRRPIHEPPRQCPSQLHFQSSHHAKSLAALFLCDSRTSVSGTKAMPLDSFFTESDIFAPRELLSPTKIEKVIGKPKANADKHEALAKLVKKESSGIALVPDTDVRESHKNSAAS